MIVACRSEERDGKTRKIIRIGLHREDFKRSRLHINEAVILHINDAVSHEEAEIFFPSDVEVQIILAQTEQEVLEQLADSQDGSESAP